jgi:hypothetical protein
MDTEDVLAFECVGVVTAAKILVSQEVTEDCRKHVAKGRIFYVRNVLEQMAKTEELSVIEHVR